MLTNEDCDVGCEGFIANNCVKIAAILNKDYSHTMRASHNLKTQYNISLLQNNHKNNNNKLDLIFFYEFMVEINLILSNFRHGFPFLLFFLFYFMFDLFKSRPFFFFWLLRAEILIFTQLFFFCCLFIKVKPIKREKEREIERVEESGERDFISVIVTNC